MISRTANSVTILIYHSLNTLENPYIRQPNMVFPENFSAQMAFLAASKKVICLEDYVTWLKIGQPIAEECFIITFDDGYRDNYTVAYPLLRKYQLPATFFLATSYIGSGRVKWEDRVNYMIRQSPVTSYSLPIGEGHTTISLLAGDLKEKLRIINRIVNFLKQVGTVERELLIEQLQKQSGIPEAQMDGKDLMLSWEEVREMAETPGISFGSHTQMHLPLSRMTEEEITGEVKGSKRAIEAAINRPVRTFSFPYGEESDPRMASILRSCGFDCAVSGSYGENRSNSDVYRLKRVNAMNQSGIRFWAGIQLRRSYAGEGLRNLYNRVKRISLL